MFIPRTLAGGDLRLGRGPFARAIIVTLLLAAALTVILTLSVVPGQVALDVGQVAQSEIRAPRAIHFPSQSQTDAARLAAANAIPPQYEQIAPPADIASTQLKALDVLVGGVTTVLQQRDRKAASGDALIAKLSDATQNRLTSAQITQRAAMSVAHTEQAGQAARDKVDPVDVQVRQNEVIVRAGDPITQLDLEKLDQLGLT